MKGSEFVFDSVDLLHYHLQKISLKRGGSYVDSSKWQKNKKATINPKNNDDKCFQYALTVASNIKTSKTIQREYQKLVPLLISVTGKKEIFQHTKKTGKSLN